MSGNSLKEQIIQAALVGYKDNLRLVSRHQEEVKYYEKILLDAGYNFNQEVKSTNSTEKKINGTQLTHKGTDISRVTPFEQSVLNILNKENKEKLAIEIADIYNKSTGKNYSRKNMSSALAKMEKKHLIIGRKLRSGRLGKLLWSLPKWNNDNGIKVEYKNDIVI